MSLSPLHLALTRIQWSYFVTLTFGTSWRTMPQSRVLKIVFKWLRVVAKIHGADWDTQWLWAVRGELGEQTGRFHLHVLLGIHGKPLVPNSKSTRFRMMSLWEKFGGGMARIRAYSDTLEGVGYILKGLDDNWTTRGDHTGYAAPRSAEGADCYEVGRFDPRSCDVMVGHTVIRLLARYSTNNRRLSARAFRARCRRLPTSVSPI